MRVKAPGEVCAATGVNQSKGGRRVQIPWAGLCTFPVWERVSREWPGAVLSWASVRHKAKGHLERAGRKWTILSQDPAACGWRLEREDPKARALTRRGASFQLALTHQQVKNLPHGQAALWGKFPTCHYSPESFQLAITHRQVGNLPHDALPRLMRDAVVISGRARRRHRHRAERGRGNGADATRLTGARRREPTDRGRRRGGGAAATLRATTAGGEPDGQARETGQQTVYSHGCDPPLRRGRTVFGHRHPGSRQGTHLGGSAKRVTPLASQQRPFAGAGPAGSCLVLLFSEANQHSFSPLLHGMAARIGDQ
jgi:hypothetical protein